MKRGLVFVAWLFLSASFLLGQDTTPAKGKFLIGFTGVFPTGVWPATTLTNMGTTSYLKDFDHPVKSYGMGVIIQRKVATHINLLFDVNVYDYNIFLAHEGDDVTSSWTEAEGATHWDEPGAPQILYVHNLPTDVKFDMQTLGVRVGARYLFLTGNVHPWAGLCYGVYDWIANYYSGDKSQTYGTDDGVAMGLTCQAGVDLEVSGMVLTAFVDYASPVAYYSMEGLFYPEWDVEDWDSPVMGTTRIGITLSFASTHKNKNK